MSIERLIQLQIRQNELQEATLLEMRGINESLQRMTATPPAVDEWLDNADLKVLLKISDVSIWRLRNDNQLLCKKIRGKWFYSRRSVLELVDAGTNTMKSKS
jgi:hypothetical protein